MLRRLINCRIIIIIIIINRVKQLQQVHKAENRRYIKLNCGIDVSTESIAATTVTATPATDHEDDFAASGPGIRSTQQSRNDNLAFEYSQWRILPPNSVCSINILMSKHALFLK